jgi:hypothetical protein
MIGPKRPVLLGSYSPSQDLQGLVRLYHQPGKQGDMGTDEKGYTTDRLAVCSTASITSDVIIQFIAFESENASGWEWDCG